MGTTFARYRRHMSATLSCTTFPRTTLSSCHRHRATALRRSRGNQQCGVRRRAPRGDVRRPGRTTARPIWTSRRSRWLSRVAPVWRDHLHDGCGRHSPRASQPPTAELSRRLSSWGARVVAGRQRAADVERTAAGGPPKRVLLLGGARSGKSVEAERWFAAEPSVTYVATSIVDPTDEEWVARVRMHRARRPANWTAIESTDLAPLLREASGPLLVDCLTLWLGAVLHEPDLRKNRPVGRRLAGDNFDGDRRDGEVGAGVIPATESGDGFATSWIGSALASRRNPTRCRCSWRVGSCGCDGTAGPGRRRAADSPTLAGRPCRGTGTPGHARRPSGARWAASRTCPSGWRGSGRHPRCRSPGRASWSSLATTG